MVRILTFLVIAVIVGRALAGGIAPPEALASADNDDIMRLMSVRAWLQGQSWFDMVQYRMLPPGGLDLHWSRYVDLGLATIIWPLAQVLPMETAEAIALVAWPTLLLVLLALLTAHAGQRLFGPVGGMVAVLGVLLWPATGQAYFSPGRIDHHNVQILLTTAMVVALVWPAQPGRAWRMGLLGGLAGAASLAVGLEMLLPVVAASLLHLGLVVALRPDANGRLLGFALALALGSAALFAGQVSVSGWSEMHCDELSPPFLALTATGAALSAVLVVILPRLPGPVARITVTAGLSAAVLWALMPLVQPCLAGPYGALPEDVQKVITGRIFEARPALDAILSGKIRSLSFLFPAAAAVVLATVLWGVRLLRWSGLPEDKRAETRIVGLLLVFGWLGVIGCLFQIRLILMAAAVIPLLTGFVLTALRTASTTRPGAPAPALALLGAMAATLFFAPLFSVVYPHTAAGQAQIARPTTSDCRTAEILGSLAEIPPGVVFTASNFGAPLLLLTPHQVVTGPYHRSPAAMADGVLPFDGDEAGMRAALARTGADYLLLCRDRLYGRSSSFATALAAGTPAARLTPVTGIDPALLLLKVD